MTILEEYRDTMRPITNVAGRIASLGAVCQVGLLDMLFPPACTACGVQLAEGGPATFCEGCSDQFARFEPPFCSGCGASVPVELDEHTTCGHCSGKRPKFSGAVSLAPYEGLVRDLLLRAKKPHGEFVAVALARRLMLERTDWFSQSEFDVVCAIPMHWQRRIRRLCNSPATMADVVARELSVPLAANLLVRTRPTAPQYTLPPSSRLKNVRRAFRVGAGYRLQSAHVLLVDDILTTGATCNEAARALLRAGANRVSVAVIGRSYSGR